MNNSELQLPSLEITQLPPFEIFNLQPKSPVPGNGYEFADGTFMHESDRFAAWAQGVFGAFNVPMFQMMVIKVALDPEVQPMVTTVLGASHFCKLKTQFGKFSGLRPPNLPNWDAPSVFRN